MNHNYLIGGFVSAAGGIDQIIARATDNQFSAAMCFIGSPHSWRLPQIDKETGQSFAKKRQQSKIQYVIAHALYLINLCTPEETLYQRSITALTQTLVNASSLAFDGVCFHLGSHKGQGVAFGVSRTCKAIEQILGTIPQNIPILIENSVQEGNKSGTTFEELGQIFKSLKNPQLKLCVDTCHTFATGYDFNEKSEVARMFADIDQHVGLKNLACFHVNDSKFPPGNNRDRHENIGQGYIGKTGFQNLLAHPNFIQKPLILEVPGLDDNGPSFKDKQALEALLPKTV